MKNQRFLLWLFSLLTGTATMIARQYPLHGTVLDEAGDGIVGATLMVEGSSYGTATDLDGNFTLDVSDGDVLSVSYIGYLGQKIKINGQSELTITMLVDDRELDEVVVVGYGSMQRKNFTGAASTVKVADTPLSLIPTVNAVDALRGTVPGITLSQPIWAGDSPLMTIRGQKSFRGDSSPLIVLDGVIYHGSIIDIDPSSVESISVLKDASSLAAYGSQAANGIIMITTKKGAEGKPIVSLSSSWAWSDATFKPDLLSPADYVRKNNILAGLDENADPTWMSKFEYDNYKEGRTTDWYDYATRTGMLQNYTLSVSGATGKVNYYVSGSYTDQKVIMKGDDFSRFVMNTRLSSDVTDWLQLGAQMNYAHEDYSGVSIYDLYQTVRLSPYGQPTRLNGEINKYPVNSGAYINPLWDLLSNTIDDSEISNITSLKGHFILKCPWVKGLQFRMNGSFTLENQEFDYFTHEGYYVREMSGVAIGDADAYYTDSAVSAYLASANGYNYFRKNKSWVWDNILSYTGQFNEHYVDATLVYTRDSYEYQTRQMIGFDFKALGNTNLGYDGLNLAATQRIQTPGYSRHTDVGYLARVNYSFDQRYHISASIRRDGSSVFGAGKKWGTFPALGVAWTLSNESFMEKVVPVTNLKLKASWGKNGNQSLSPYQTLSTISLGQSEGLAYTFGNSSNVSWGQRITAIGNVNLGWETTESWNYGFELGLFDNRVNLDFDAYTSKTTDMIFRRSIPVMINGFTSMYDTMGRVDNWGIEASINTANIRTKDWSWNSNLNFYMNRNKLKELYGDGKDDISNNFFIGQGIGTIYGYKDIGIVQVEDTEYMEKNGAQPGDVMFADIDGDGVITSADRQIVGNYRENFRMGFGNTVTYKDFQLFVLFTGIFGGNGYGMGENTYAYRTMSDVATDNGLNHGWWTEENRSNKYPRINYTDNRFLPLQDYSFVRLSDLSLSYSFNQPALKACGIRNLKVFFACRNLFTITKWIGGDPEIRQTLSRGYYDAPVARSFSLGINLSF